MCITFQFPADYGIFKKSACFMLTQFRPYANIRLEVDIQSTTEESTSKWMFEN